MRNRALWPLAVALSLTTPVATSAAACDLDIPRAYDVAVKRGWTFKCDNGVLHFDQQKRPGCAIKPVVNINEIARFFTNWSVPDPGKRGHLRNGWQLDFIEVSGGPWTPLVTIEAAKPSRVHFVFDAKGGGWTRRYLSKLVLKKKNGNCSEVYEEAF